MTLEAALKYSSVWYVAESVMCFSLWIFWVFPYHFNFCEAICSLATPYVVFTISVALLFFYFLIKAVRADLISPWCGCRVPTGGHLLCVGLLAAVFVKLSRRDDRLDVLGVASLQWWQLMCAGIADIWGRGLDGFGGILLADEDLQQAEFGLDPLVLSVRLQHRHPVLLLNISKRGTRAELWGFCCEVLCFYFSALSTFAASIWNADFLLVEFPCRSVCWSLSAMSDLLSYCWAWWTWSSCSFTSANLFWQEMQCVYCQAGGASIRIFFLTKNWSRRNFCSF